MDVDVVNADVVELCVCTEKRFARGTSIWGGRVGRYCTPIDVEASNGADCCVWLARAYELRLEEVKLPEEVGRQIGRVQEGFSSLLVD